MQKNKILFTGMRAIAKWNSAIGMLVFALALGLTLVGCGGGDDGGDGTPLSDFIGTWKKSTGEKVVFRGDDSKYWLDFYISGNTGYMDLSCEGEDYAGSITTLENDFNDSYSYPVSVTVSGSTLTISGFTGTYDDYGSLDLTQFNGTYEKQ